MTKTGIIRLLENDKYLQRSDKGDNIKEAIYQSTFDACKKDYHGITIIVTDNNTYIIASLFYSTFSTSFHYTVPYILSNEDIITMGTEDTEWADLKEKSFLVDTKSLGRLFYS